MPPPLRASDMIFKEDVRNMLRSILLAHEMTAQQSNTQDLIAYREGFSAAVLSVATALDISLGIPVPNPWYDTTG